MSDVSLRTHVGELARLVREGYMSIDDWAFALTEPGRRLYFELTGSLAGWAKTPRFGQANSQDRYIDDLLVTLSDPGVDD